MLPMPVFQAGFRLIDGSALNQMATAIQNAVVWPGNFIYLDPKNGSDANTGATPTGAFQTLGQAFTLARAGKNDVIVLISDGTTASTVRLSATFAWNKNAVHMIGICAPSFDSQRARISHPTTQTTNITPLIALSSNDCIFMNFSIFQGVGQASTDEQLIDITGQRNYFYNVSFQGMGHANGAARSGSYIIAFKNLGSENLFEHCSIGLETIARSAANASVVIPTGVLVERNMFRGCEFAMLPSSATALYLNIAAGTMNSSTMTFDRCNFKALIGVGGGTQPAVVATVTAAANGNVYFNDCKTEAAKWALTNAQVYVNSGATVSASAGGIAVTAP